MKVSSTAERLQFILSYRQLRQADILAACAPYCRMYDVKIGRNDLSQYVSGKVEPKQDKLAILAMALNLSETWLMGYDVPMSRDIEGDAWSDDFRKALKHEIDNGDWDATKPESDAVFQEADRLLESNSSISLSEACSMADSFGFSLDDAVGLDRHTLPPKTKEFVALFSELTEEQQLLIISQIKGILANQNTTKSSDDFVRIYRAARSDDNHSGEIVQMSKKDWQELKDAPETDELL